MISPDWKRNMFKQIRILSDQRKANHVFRKKPNSLAFFLPKFPKRQKHALERSQKRSPAWQLSPIVLPFDVSEIYFQKKTTVFNKNRVLLDLFFFLWFLSQKLEHSTRVCCILQIPFLCCTTELERNQWNLLIILLLTKKTHSLGVASQISAPIAFPSSPNCKTDRGQHFKVFSRNHNQLPRESGLQSPTPCL